MKPRQVLRGSLACIVALLLSVTAQAQLFRAYLASDGSDANACTLQAPCRLLPRALTTVGDGGEIWMLDSANYNTGPVNIAKSVTILAIPGALGSVLATAGNAIDITTAGVKVALRNLVIVPLPGGGGTSGIRMTAGAGLTVDNCLIAALPGEGIFVNGAASVRITGTTIRDNDIGLWFQNGARATVTRSTISGNTGHGVFVYGAVATTSTTADLADSTIDGNNLIGLFARSQHASGLVNVSVRDSRAVGNGSYGLVAQSDSGAAVTLSVSNNIISNNLNGIGSLIAGSKVWASGNTVSDNGNGLVVSGGIFESAGNNAVRNNTTADTFGTITVIAPK